MPDKANHGYNEDDRCTGHRLASFTKVKRVLLRKRGGCKYSGKKKTGDSKLIGDWEKNSQSTMRIISGLLRNPCH